MKYLGILAFGALAAACASHNNPPVASADSVEQASSTPSTGPDFTPVGSDATAAASGDGHPTQKAQSAASAAQTPATSPDSPTQGTAMDNAAAMPAQSRATEPDNSRVNARDKGGNTLTPMDQGPSEGDRKITQQIRQAVVKDGALSFTAKNVKIITINGKVTLRGPVKTDAERASIEAAAKKIAGATQVENLLEVKN
jgi:hyperosmotically inducible periplasmic protein